MLIALVGADGVDGGVAEHEGTQLSVLDHLPAFDCHLHCNGAGDEQHLGRFGCAMVPVRNLDDRLGETTMNPLNEIEDKKAWMDFGKQALLIYRGAIEEGATTKEAQMAVAAFYEGMFRGSKEQPE
jgi:hypothetical protein